MKRRDLEKRLRVAGCILKREGGSHSLWTNPRTGIVEAVPRHPEIKEDKAQLLEAVMTPQMRLRILVNQVRRRGDAVSNRHVDRVVNKAVKRVRRAAGAR